MLPLPDSIGTSHNVRSRVHRYGVVKHLCACTCSITYFMLMHPEFMPTCIHSEYSPSDAPPADLRFVGKPLVEALRP